MNTETSGFVSAFTKALLPHDDPSPSARRTAATCTAAASAAIRRARLIRWTAGVALLGAVSAVSACTSASSQASGTKSPAASSPASAATGAASQKSAPSKSPATSADQSDAVAVVGAWVTDEVENRLELACRVLAIPQNPSDSSSPLAPATPAECNGTSTQASGVLTSLRDLHKFFITKGQQNPPKVIVTGVPTTSNTVTFSGDQITVDGQTLKDLVVSNSSGVTASEVSISVEAAELNGRWWVGNYNISVN